ncbi:unnamed protein product [Schistocephalus solidus]|uniref:DUF3480 domain-containing protein n=1 Tax=Schistocephalus solidus TaxID=70667 RepID=A0A183SSD1_SCHSO|nr:unnamed protein product [Schistocephalus solidus]
MCRQDDGLAHLQFGVQVNTITIPQEGLQPAECLTNFGNPLGKLVIDCRVASKISKEATLAFREQALLYVTVQKFEKNTGEYLSSDVEQRYAFVIITGLRVPLLLVEMEDGRFFEILRKLSLVPHLLKECCDVCYQLSAYVLVDFWWDCVASRCFTAGNLLHGPNGFWLGKWQIKVIVCVHLKSAP